MYSFKSETELNEFYFNQIAAKLAAENLTYKNITKKKGFYALRNCVLSLKLQEILNKNFKEIKNKMKAF